MNFIQIYDCFAQSNLEQFVDIGITCAYCICVLSTSQFRTRTQLFFQNVSLHKRVSKLHEIDHIDLISNSTTGSSNYHLSNDPLKNQVVADYRASPMLVTLSVTKFMAWNCFFYLAVLSVSFFVVSFKKVSSILSCSDPE